jgi:DNA-binding MarR family transcriptional regulator
MAVARELITAGPPSSTFEERMRDFFGPRGVDIDAQAVAFSLFRTQADYFSAIERASLRPLGLTHASFTLMMSLWMFGSQETRRLAAGLGVSRPAVVSVVNTLEARGLVRRVRSDVDRRLVTVELTRRGQRLVEKGQAAAHRDERHLAAALTPSEQRALARLLKKLGHAARSTLHEHNAGPSRIAR